jgi:hypothetical protein
VAQYAVVPHIQERSRLGPEWLERRLANAVHARKLHKQPPCPHTMTDRFTAQSGLKQLRAVHKTALRSRDPRHGQIPALTNPQNVKNRRRQESLVTDRALCPTNAPSVRLHSSFFTKRGLEGGHT